MKYIAGMCRKFGKWLNGKSRTVSKFCEEDFTRKEVIKVHIGMIAAFLSIGFAETHTMLSLVIICIIAIFILGSAGGDEKEHA